MAEIEGQSRLEYKTMSVCFKESVWVVNGFFKDFDSRRFKSITKIVKFSTVSLKDTIG